PLIMPEDGRNVAKILWEITKQIDTKVGVKNGL
ncbi:unnamed protein product, partial [marine sediment metagenome]